MKYSFRALKSSNKECTNNKNVRARKLLAKLWAPTVTLKDRQRLTVTAIYWSKRFKKYNTKYKNCRGKSAEHWHKGSFLTISPASSSTYSEEVSWFGGGKKKKRQKSVTLYLQIQNITVILSDVSGLRALLAKPALEYLTIACIKTDKQEKNISV